ncbi:hypothetical protein EVAR_73964_1 [Eumeta japonica]|uniref:Uncharacterized protein n=1 Tax=Eumeta variegata TaxID=151549 RepID=A0A4C1T8Q1_EUMVA|nr:hypothetical protein EVAR_73964_1 [Eumeta japonica]
MRGGVELFGFKVFVVVEAEVAEDIEEVDKVKELLLLLLIPLVVELVEIRCGEEDGELLEFCPLAIAAAKGECPGKNRNQMRCHNRINYVADDDYLTKREFTCRKPAEAVFAFVNGDE